MKLCLYVHGIAAEEICTAGYCVVVDRTLDIREQRGRFVSKGDMANGLVAEFAAIVWGLEWIRENVTGRIELEIVTSRHHVADLWDNGCGRDELVLGIDRALEKSRRVLLETKTVLRHELVWVPLSDNSFTDILARCAWKEATGREFPIDFAAERSRSARNENVLFPSALN